MTCGGGGVLASEDSGAIARAYFVATQARGPALHYQRSQIVYNYRMSNLLAADGRGQLRRLDSVVKERRQHFEYYREHPGDLPGFEFMPKAPHCFSTRWLRCAVIDTTLFAAGRDEVLAALAAENIEARPVWKPMHLQPVFGGCEAFGGDVAADLFERGICLPSGSNMLVENRARVVELVQAAAR